MRRGLAADDATVIVEQAGAWTATFLGTGPGVPALLPLLRDRLDPRSFSMLLDATVDAQARGPLTEPPRAVWRLLFEEGCPLDHIWRVLRHAFADPDSDPQERVTVAPEVALAQARRYVALRFPRASGPWPGLGCRNALDCVRARVGFFAQHETFGAFHALDEIRKLRAVVSPTLAGAIDEEVGIDRQPEAATRAEAFDLARRWVQALDERLRAGGGVHDLDRDRFASPDEAHESSPPRRRAAPDQPDDRMASLRVLIAPWGEAYAPPWGKKETDLEDLLARRDWDEPLEWLESVAERALVEWDDEARPRLRG